jgi:hypothetical protein
MKVAAHFVSRFRVRRLDQGLRAGYFAACATRLSTVPAHSSLRCHQLPRAIHPLLPGHRMNRTLRCWAIAIGAVRFMKAAFPASSGAPVH